MIILKKKRITEEYFGCFENMCWLRVSLLLVKYMIYKNYIISPIFMNELNSICK